MRSQQLICDVGGTNARFALIDGTGAPEKTRVLPVAAFSSFDQALSRYLVDAGATPTAAAIAAAGPVFEGCVQLTNAPWIIRAQNVADRLGGIPVHLLNDLEAVAFALPNLGADEVEPIARARLVPGRQPMLAVNVGTGFGAAVAIPTASGWTALGTEAGHIHLDAGPFGDGAKSIEDVFSGPGYQRVFGSADAPPPHDPAVPVSSDLDECHGQYSRLFGRVIGDLVLATGSWGGAFLCGGALANFRHTISVALFLDGFIGKGCMTSRHAHGASL